MDTIYSNNKNYSQRLKAGNDFYRSCTLKPTANEYVLSPATIDRRSTLGTAYSHHTLSKYSLHDSSYNYNYGYSTWGPWNDNKTLAPSISLSSYNKQKNIKSFTLILMTAALIVVLAVISIAGLAFYFSSYRSDGTESILVFDGNFLVTKGDIYTPGLKYNQTTLYRQKAQFYDRLIRTALENQNIVIKRSEINNFGNGPSIVVDFRIFLDMRQIPLTINNVEQHISTALIDEVSSPTSDFQNISIDADSIEITRILDSEVLREAMHYEIPTPDSSIATAPIIPTQTYTPSVLTEKEKLMKKSGFIEKTVSRFKPNISPKPKTQSTRPAIQESDIDMENLPVIQGSFEITKTDADITQRRENVTTPGHVAMTTTTMKPFVISPGTSIKIREKSKPKEENLKYHTAMIEKVLNTKPAVLGTTKSTTTTTTTRKPETTTQMVQDTTLFSETIPVLDVRLFTSAPVIDNAPWKPITPSVAPKPVLASETTTISTTSRDAENLKVVPLHSSSTTTTTTTTTTIPTTEMTTPEPSTKTSEDPTNLSNYKSYTNAEFSTSSSGIEKLGTANVRPFPIPVNKIVIPDDDIIISPPPYNKYYSNLHAPLESKEGGQDSATVNPKKDIDNKTVNPFAIHLSEILYDFLEIRDDNSRTPTFFNANSSSNISSIADSYGKTADVDIESDLTTEEPLEEDEDDSTEIMIASSTEYMEPVSLIELPSSTTPQPSTQPTTRWTNVGLFPMHSMVERRNGTAPMRKVFNETLQAYVVADNEERDIDEEIENDDVSKSETIQNISSIFDQLSSKLGIQPNITVKNPPFASVNKLKTKNRTTTKITTTSTTEKFYPIEYSTNADEDDMSTPVEVGQAEIEEIDPSYLEEMLKQQNVESTTQVVQLITLLPVKSNVGIRNYRRPGANQERAFPSTNFKSFNIKTSINVENK